jgi:hypothetical protein
MVNYQKTEQAFNSEPNKHHNIKYEKHPQQKQEERFFAVIKNPTTGNYIQYKDLASDYRTDDSKANKVYPVVRVIQLIRVKTPDNREWVKSKQEWIGLDSAGNEVDESFTDPEIWDKPIFKYKMMPRDHSPNSPLERRAVDYTLKPEYTKPFTKENVKELYAKANPNAVSLVIQRVDTNGMSAGHPYLIDKYQDFVGKSFDELWDYMSTPKFKLDRSYEDNLEANHIK